MLRGRSGRPLGGGGRASNLYGRLIGGRCAPFGSASGGKLKTFEEIDMSPYELSYWSVPFRGQFVRAILAFAGQEWTETEDEAISKLMQGPVSAMPVPFMGPPVLVHTATGFAVSQMPAIVLYLGETLGLMPATAELRALTMKVVNDANDVIDELSLDGGKELWTEARWQQFKPRLRKWMTMWEELGRRHGLTQETGFLLGGTQTGVADVITATLWSTVTDRFDRIDELLAETAPCVSALSKRISALTPLMGLDARTRRDFGDAYAGGQIGASMKTILTS